MLVPILFLPIVWAYKAISKEPVIPLTHPVALMPFIVATVLLLYVTAYIWSRWGYSPGWLFPTLVAATHLLLGGARGADRGNQAQAYGVVFGVMIYGLTRLF